MKFKNSSSMSTLNGDELSSNLESSWFMSISCGDPTHWDFLIQLKHLFKITWIYITKLLIWHMNPPVPLLYDALEHRDGFSVVFSLLFIISLQVSLIGSTAHRNHTQISSRSAISFYFYADSHSLTLRLIFNRLMMISSLCEKIVELLIFLSWILFTRPLKPGGREEKSK